MKDTIKEHMQKNVITVPPSATLKKCASIMASHKIGCLVVIDKNNKPVNIITKTDILRAISTSSLNNSIEQCNHIAKHLITLKENQTLFDLITIFNETKIKHIPVVDETTGCLTGIISSSDIISNLNAISQITELIKIDPLTRLMNRHHLTSIKFNLERKIHSGIAILMVDLDNFKQINDTYGHQFGDSVLRKVGQKILVSIRPYDDAIRYGGEEFLIILYRLTTRDAPNIAERIRHNIEQISFKEHPEVKITVSIGLTFFDPTKCSSLDNAIHQADKALYQAKQQGKNKVVIFKLNFLS